MKTYKDLVLESILNMGMGYPKSIDESGKMAKQKRDTLMAAVHELREEGIEKKI